MLITESIIDVPFDLRALRVLEYDKNDPGWGDVLREKIAASIREVLESPLQAVLPSFLDVDLTKRAPVSTHEKELLAIRQELEVLRAELRRTRLPEAADAVDRVRLVRRVRDLRLEGLSDDAIVRTLAREGVAPEVTRRRIASLRVIERVREQVSAKRALVGTEQPAAVEAGTSSGTSST